MRIILSTEWWPVHNAHSYRRALLRRGDVEVITLGPSTGNWMPWRGGIRIPEKFVVEPDVEFPRGAEWLNTFEQAEALLRYHGITEWDAWVQVDKGWHLRGRPSKGLGCLVVADGHVLIYKEQRRDADIVFCVHRGYCQPGDVYMPHAYDPEIHTPSPIPWDERKFDLVVCGIPYPHRTAVADEMKLRGYKVWEGSGPAYDEYARLYHNSRLGYNWSALRDLIPKVFEITAMRLPLVCNNVPGLDEFFVDCTDVWTFNDSVEDCVEKMETLLAHPDEAEELAENGYRAVKPHTYDSRVEIMLDAILARI